MNIPFTKEEFLNVFKSYNESVFPAQLVFILAAAAILFLIIKKNKISDRIISLLLSILWIWIGIVYHLIFFTEINKAAYIFGPVFIIEGLVFFFYGTVYNLFSFSVHYNFFNLAGILLIIYSLIVYPLIGYIAGHGYPYSPTFGLPCPTTIFTVGVLLFANKKIPFTIIIIPFLWSLIGSSAAVSLSIYEDTGLLIAGITGLVYYFFQKRKEPLIVGI